MQPPQHSHRFTHRIVVGLVVAVALWAFIAYIVMPRIWAHEMRLHPALADAPTITHTGAGIPGDALNLSLIGDEEMIIRAMLAAGWHPADPITLRSSERIALDTLFHRPYENAPVSNLFLWGRKEDLAYELPVGDDPKKRHHVRFWKSKEVDASGLPLWMGAATFDERVGLSKTTGQITHHIGPDIDADRDLIIAHLQKAGWVTGVDWIEDFQDPPEGRNGGGDAWHTDGRLGVARLKTASQVSATAPPNGPASTPATAPAQPPVSSPGN